MKSIRGFILSRVNDPKVDEIFKNNRSFVGVDYYLENKLIHFNMGVYYKFKQEGIEFLIREGVKLKCDFNGIFKGEEKSRIISVDQVKSPTSLFIEHAIIREGVEEDFNFLMKNISFDKVKTDIEIKLAEDIKKSISSKVVKEENVKMEFDEDKGFIIPKKEERFLDF